MLCGFALTISGCEKPDLGPDIDVESTIQPLEYSRPSMSPQFNSLDFTIASLD